MHRFVVLCLVAMVFASPAFAHKLKFYDRTGPYGQINCLAFSPDKKLLAGGDDYSVRIWDVTTCQKLTTLIGHSGRVLTVSFSADGKKISSTGEDRIGRVWDTATGRQLEYNDRSKDSGGVVNAARKTLFESIPIFPVPWQNPAPYRTNGIEISRPSPSVLDICNTASGAKIGSVDGLGHLLKCFCLSSDNSLIATYDDEAAIKIWSLPQCRVVGTIKGNSPTLKAVSVSSANNLIAAACGDRARLWDLKRGGRVREFRGYECSADLVALSDDGTRLACGGKNSSATTIWNVDCGLRSRIIYGAQSSGHMVFTANGKYLAADGFWSGTLWDIANGQQVQKYLPSGRGANSSIAISHDQKKVAVNHYGNIKLLDLISGKEITSFQSFGTAGSNPVDVCFDCHDSSIAVGHRDGAVKIYDIATGAETQSFAVDSPSDPSLAYSPDGKILAIGYKYGGLKLWHVDSGKEPIKIPGQTASVFSLTFMSDGAHVLTASNDGCINIYDAKAGRKVGSINFLGGTDYVVTDTHGHYDATDMGSSILAFRKGKNFVSLDQLSKTHLKPGLLNSLLKSKLNAKTS